MMIMTVLVTEDIFLNVCIVVLWPVLDVELSSVLPILKMPLLASAR
jgi:hypothetical protein